MAETTVLPRPTVYHPALCDFPACHICGRDTWTSPTGFYWCSDHGPVWTPDGIRLAVVNPERAAGAVTRLLVRWTT
jgi:hypothetical protein